MLSEINISEYASSISLIILLVGHGTVLVSSDVTVDTSTGFHAETICDFAERVERGCSYEIRGVKGTLRCVQSCALNTACNGISTDQNGTCFQHQNCRSLYNTCVHADTGHSYFSKRCHNGGLWVAETSTCQCQGYWLGDRCQAYPTSCSDLHHFITVPLYFTIYIDFQFPGQEPLLVPCYYDPTSGYNNVLLSVNKGSTDYNLTWSQFRDGVYHLDSPQPVWSGLKQWHFLSQRGYTTLYVQFDSAAGQILNFYTQFNISDESNGFRFSYTNTFLQMHPGLLSVCPNVGPCLGGFQNVPFSTWDRDQDTSSGENCAALRGSGWWFTDCQDITCNPLGWGPQHFGSKPARERMSWDGCNLAPFANISYTFYMYLIN